MKRILVTTLLATIASVSAPNFAFADHDRLIRRDYEVRRVSLEQDYKAQRDANRYAYHRERDILRAQRQRAVRIECRDTRALRVRALNRELAAAARTYNLRNRELTAWYHSERDALRTSYEIARRNARVTPVVTTRYGSHPANCECNVCHPPAPVPQVCPDRRVLIQDDYRFERDYVPAISRRSPNAMDWAGLILGLLN